MSNNKGGKPSKGDYIGLSASANINETPDVIKNTEELHKSIQKSAREVIQKFKDLRDTIDSMHGTDFGNPNTVKPQFFDIKTTPIKKSAFLEHYKDKDGVTQSRFGGFDIIP